MTYDIDRKKYVLVYPDFTEDEKIEEGAGDSNDTQTMRSYLLYKAEKQENDMPLAQQFLVRTDSIQEKIRNDMQVTCFGVLEYDFFQGNHYQDLIWMNEDGGYNINVL